METTRIILQERDIELLLHAYNAKILSGAEISALFFNATPFAYKRLRKLEKANYLASASYSFASNRHNGKYYRLAQKALKELVSRGHIDDTKAYASQIAPPPENINYLLKLGLVRTALVTSNIITLDEWQFPHNVRANLALQQFVPISCQIRDVLIMRVSGTVSRYLSQALELAERLTDPLSHEPTGISSVIILYETKREHERLLAKYTNGTIHISTFADLPLLLADLLTNAPSRHMGMLISRFRALYPSAVFDPPLCGSVTVSPTGINTEQKTLLVNGITGGLAALHQFWGWTNNFRVMLVRDGADIRLIQTTSSKGGMP